MTLEVSPVPVAVEVDLLARIRKLSPRLGHTVLVAIDGRSGAGKSTLAARLAASMGAMTVQLEYLYPGWDGLDAGVQNAVDTVLKPFSRGAAADVPQWDWQSNKWGIPMRIAPPRYLLLEGVGAASAAIRRWTDLAIWLELPQEERLLRARVRGWETYEGHWDSWAVQEDALMARENLPQSADLVLVGSQDLPVGPQ
ncbi:MAG: hypothetical protein WCJ42_00460 [Actinomycetes bacterium]